MRRLRGRRSLLVLGLAAMLALPAVVAALPDSSATPSRAKLTMRLR